jgi:hypothetical protein
MNSVTRICPLCGAESSVEIYCPAHGRVVTPRQFPLLYSHRSEAALRARLPSVPWAFAVVAERQAYLNHEQTLGWLAVHGGLSPLELLCALDGVGLFDCDESGERFFRRPESEAAAEIERRLDASPFAALRERSAA